MLYLYSLEMAGDGVVIPVEEHGKPIPPSQTLMALNANVPVQDALAS